MLNVMYLADSCINASFSPRCPGMTEGIGSSPVAQHLFAGAFCALAPEYPSTPALNLRRIRAALPHLPDDRRFPRPVGARR